MWRDAATWREAALRWGHRLDVVMTVGAFVVFAMLWAGLAYAQLADRTLPGDAWTWLRALEPVPQVVVWIVVLPIAVGLWIWTSEWPPLVGALLGLVLVAWSVAGLSGVVRLLRSK